MSSEEKYICSGYNKSRGMTGMLHFYSYKKYYKCSSKGVIFEEDKWWCKRHAPSKIEEREAKVWNRYIDKINKNVELTNGN